MTDLLPLCLLLQGLLEFGAEGDVIGVVEHDAHHLSRQVLKPGHSYHLTELERDKQRHTLQSTPEIKCYSPASPVEFIHLFSILYAIFLSDKLWLTTMSLMTEVVQGA